jgi:putative Mg2+ transporter-C (MgtC) family protein
VDITPVWPVEVQLELVLRLGLSVALGAVIGLERERDRQAAGLRTHILVTLGATLFTIVSAYGFSGPSADPTRIAAQIVTGIGFIGAGAILHHRGSVHGLTTAASLWAVAAIGMAAGAGLYPMAIASTGIVLVVLWLLDRVAHAARGAGVLPPDPEGNPDGALKDHQ